MLDMGRRPDVANQDDVPTAARAEPPRPPSRASSAALISLLVAGGAFTVTFGIIMLLVALGPMAGAALGGCGGG
jgi:hypothetical protein